MFFYHDANQNKIYHNRKCLNVIDGDTHDIGLEILRNAIDEDHLVYVGYFQCRRKQLPGIKRSRQFSEDLWFQDVVDNLNSSVTVFPLAVTARKKRIQKFSSQILAEFVEETSEQILPLDKYKTIDEVISQFSIKVNTISDQSGNSMFEKQEVLVKYVRLIHEYPSDIHVELSKIELYQPCICWLNYQAR